MRRAPIALAALALLTPAPAARAAVPNTWTPARALLEPLTDASVTTLPGGRVFVFGGRNVVNRYMSQLPRPVAEIFSPAGGTWAGVADHGILIADSVRGVGLAGGRVLVLGANPKPGDPQRFQTVAKVYDAARNEWTPVAGPAAGERFARLADGRVLGVGRGSGTSTSFSVWDPRTDTSTPVADAGGALGPLTRLPDGRVLATGGAPAVFDPAAGTWSRAAPPGPLEGTTVRLAGPRVLVTGSSGGPGFVYDGAARVWRSAGRAPDTVPGNATLLRDGRVFATDGTPLVQGRAWIYDPEVRRWFAAASPRAGHSGGVAAALPDGRVLVAGGVRCIDDCFDPASTNAAEIYNPPPRRPVIQRAVFSGGARPRFVDVRLNELAGVTLLLRARPRARGLVARTRSLRWRLGRTGLAPGRWTLTVTATDPFGRRARTVRVARTVR